MPVTATGHVVTRDGVGLFCRDWGAGPPVVFLASWSLPSDSWAYQMAALAEAGLRCVAYDRRGHGRSADPGSGYGFDTLADDLADVLDAYDLTDVTLVTFSAGAGEAVRYLTRHGRRRVARLALVAPTTPLLERTADNPDGVDPAIFAAFRQDELLRDWPRWLDENARPFAGPDASEAMLAWLKGMALQASLQALAAFHRELTSADFRPELPVLDLPVLVIQGEQDATCPPDLTGRRTAALVPGARLLEYAGAPHGILVSHAARLTDDLLRFVREG
jgi:pimeloyl-ACP methyl ester carboxylesterase